MRTDHSNNSLKIPFEMWTNFLQTTTLKKSFKTQIDHSNSNPKKALWNVDWSLK